MRQGECVICGAAYEGLTLEVHAAAARKRAESRDGRRDPAVKQHAKRLQWSRSATSTMEPQG